MKKIPCNDRYFKTINTEDKAYWLGFISADGNIYANTVAVKLAGIDADHLRHLNVAIERESDIRVRTRNTQYKNASYAKTVSECELKLDSVLMVSDLAAAGVFPHKSFTIAPWVGPIELMRHYWRGVFDGDGSIYVDSSQAGVSKWRINLIGSEQMIKGFVAFVVACGGLGTTVGVARKGCVGTFRAQWSSHGALFITDLLYKDCAVSLDRKLQKANELKRFINQRRIQKTMSL